MERRDTDKTKNGWQRFIELIFYGNYFYGLCAVALMLETVVELKIPFEDLTLYFIVFLATVLFYNYPYARNASASGSNPRTEWYRQHQRFVAKAQYVLSALLALLLIYFARKHIQQFRRVDVLTGLLFVIFPVVGGLYYGANFLSQKKNLRQIGWLKPFIIGFVWAGAVNVYPLLYDNLLCAVSPEFSLRAILLFLKTFMFTAMLAIMFDVKDYAADSRQGLGTLVVKMGLRRTIFYVLVPLTLLGLLTFLSYAVTYHFEFLKLVLMAVPFFLLLATAISLKKRRTLMYYLVVIDGLLIVKAVFGIAAMMV